MPPRFAYWTILIDGTATAFRAKEREELLPTFNQLRRTNEDVTIRYFARGKLWDTPEQAQWAGRNPVAGESRDRDWRPGGLHKDPRARFDKKPRRRDQSKADARSGDQQRSRDDDRPRPPRAPEEGQPPR
ncbi:MAG: hypothetical protein IT356_12645, partial [Gemmatimonadaceae bacterium]|nr:hypothetical protein [Gemmatimonadaceae bacterium]